MTRTPTPTQPQTTIPTLSRIVQLTVKYGYMPASTPGFAVHGTILFGLGTYVTTQLISNLGCNCTGRSNVSEKRNVKKLFSNQTIKYEMEKN